MKKSNSIVLSRLLPALLLFSGRYPNVVTTTEALLVPGDASWLGDYGAGEYIPDPIEFIRWSPYMYVIFGPNSDAYVRLMIPTDQQCPPLVYSNDGTLVDRPIPTVKTRAVGDKVLPYAFPFRLCETKLVSDNHKDAWTRGSLHFEGILETTPVTSDPSRFLLTGDSGLRVKPKNLGLGKCSSSSYGLYNITQCDVNFTETDLNLSQVSGTYQSLDAWPLKELQDYAAEEEADVVVYVGDYLYRQGPCPAQNYSGADCVAINGPLQDLDLGADGSGAYNYGGANFVPGWWGDNLYGWWADFFWPAHYLLKTTPMIAIRGNHENCERAGHGYFLFFGVEEYPENTTAGGYCEIYSAPFTVPFVHEQFLVMDSSDISPAFGGVDDYIFTQGACPQKPNQGDPPIVTVETSRYNDPSQNPSDIQSQISTYAADFEILHQLSLNYTTNFFAAHHPVFAIACNDSVLQSSDWTMQQSLSNHTLDRVSAIISGHMHWLLSLNYKEDALPHQIVVGHGGTSLIKNYINQDAWPGVVVNVGANASRFTGIVESGLSAADMYGYAVMERNSNNGNYLVKFRSLNTSTMEMVTLDYQVEIPKGPRVCLKSNKPCKKSGGDTLPCCAGLVCQKNANNQLVCAKPSGNCKGSGKICQKNTDCCTGLKCKTNDKNKKVCTKAESTCKGQGKNCQNDKNCCSNKCLSTGKCK